jgi:hypothetical protein
MTISKTLMLAGFAAAFCSSIGNAQMSYPSSLPASTLIYSNGFGGSGTLNITNTAPDFSTNILGGSTNVPWLDVGGFSGGQTNFMYANGSVGTYLGDTWLLPFTPQSGYVYYLTASVNLNANPGSWIVTCFAQKYQHFAIASAPPNSSINAYDWTLRNFTGNTEFFAGNAGNNNVYNSTPAVPTGAGSYTFTQVLDTTSNKWVITAFFNGVQLGSPYTFASTPTIASVGLGQHTETGTPPTYQWTSLTLAATPIVIGQQPVSASVDNGIAFTNTVVVAASTPAYQWFNNGVPVSGATNASLIINPVLPSSGGTNYYVVITNNFGSITSSPVSLTVFTNPVISAAYPVAYTNPITLFCATNDSGTNYVGSSPNFSVSVLGGLPLAYQWQTNGVAMGGATNSAFSFTNCQLTSPTNFACVVTNIFGRATNAWSVSYVQTPEAPYPQGVLALQPLGYWRLDEQPEIGGGDDGVLALESASGNNGIYTNAYFYGDTYSLITDPNETDVYFDAVGSQSAAYGIQGINFAAPTNTSANFSVAIWANSSSAANNVGLVAKGYLGAEEFVITEASSKYVFTVHDAAGNAHTATATVGPNGTWQHIVGVCNEVAGTTNVSIYVNGLLSGGVMIPSGSGLLNSSVPMTIGARSTSASTSLDLQYSGELDDAAVFNYALSGSQVANLYQLAGNAVPLSLVGILPPTNVVYQANTTLTIPATVTGQAVIGYYWTNLTTGTTIVSGHSNINANYNISLTISNAPTSLSGDQLELVATNAISFTNAFVSLFTPPPPMPLGYTNEILYSNYFNGGAWTIAGMPLTAANVLVGGTNTTWVDVLGANSTGGVQASGVDASTGADSWLLPFTPHAGYVYTVTASVTLTGNPGNWIAMGFAQSMAVNASSGGFNNGNVNGIDWILLNESSGNVQYFTGPSGTGQIFNQNGFVPAGPGTHTMTVVLDTTGPQWAISASVDGNSAGGTTYASNPSIAAVGICQYTVTVPAVVQWNYFSVTQVAPGGVPPYLLAPLPPTNNIVLTNATVTIPATAFGSPTLGYYWIDNSTVITSGLTNDMAPLPASLSIPSSSLTAGPLELVVTNAYGTNITLITLVSGVNPHPGPIQVTVTGNQLSLGWPTNLGWTLQVQTNILSTGLGTNWVNVAGSTTVTNVVVPMNPTNGSVFYRLHN